jgi:hypothetical protein
MLYGNPGGSSVYPLRPHGSYVIARVPDSCTAGDRLSVAASSLFFVGSVLWLPPLYAWAYRKWRTTPASDPKRKLYILFIVGCTALLYKGPQHARWVGRWLKVRRWKLWEAWMRYLAVEFLVDHGSEDQLISSIYYRNDVQSILAFVPHGIFPFGLAFAALPEIAQQSFGIFRPVVATAIGYFPLVRDVLSWVHPVYVRKLSLSRRRLILN